MKLAEYLRATPEIQWEYARQMGVRYAVGRMPDGHMEETAESFALLKAMKERYASAGLELKVIEPAPWNQKIKQGLPGRDEEIERTCALVTHMGQLGIEVLCYNFATYFNWSRTSSTIPDRGGALVTGYRHADIDQSAYTEVGEITAERLWDNLTYLQQAIVPVVERAGVRLALHPDDPPVPAIQHVARILNTPEAMERACNLVKSPNMGITLCQGTFAEMGCDVPQVIRRFAAQGRIHLVHFRDVRGDRWDFHETFPEDGQTDMAACVQLYPEKNRGGAYVGLEERVYTQADLIKLGITTEMVGSFHISSGFSVTFYAGDNGTGKYRAYGQAGICLPHFPQLRVSAGQ